MAPRCSLDLVYICVRRLPDFLAYCAGSLVAYRRIWFLLKGPSIAKLLKRSFIVSGPRGFAAEGLGEGTVLCSKPLASLHSPLCTRIVNNYHNRTGNRGSYPCRAFNIGGKFSLLRCILQ